MNDTVKMFLISLITAVLVQVLLGPQIIKMQMQQGLLPALAAQPAPTVPIQPAPTPAPPVATPPAPDAQIPAPNFVGTPIRDARKVASGQGIVLIEDETRDAPDAQPGEILEQIPPPGTPLINREIRVVTAKAKEARIPNLVGKPIAEAKQTLSDLGVDVTEVQKDSSKTPGTVIAQKPLPNTKLSPGTPVELTVAALPLIQVPGLTGKYLNAAKTALKDTGLELGDIKRVEHAEHGENYVLRQDPASGSKVPFGTVVNLTVVAPN
jgi:beta-lactam-binding protein with PASTA domain